MKKLFAYTFIVLSVLSCAEKQVQPEAVPAVISFAVPEVMETKSVLVENVSQLQSGADELGFAVFASRYTPEDDGAIGHDHSQFMDDVKIFSTDGGNTWKYDADPDLGGDQSFYWSPGAVHKFFAVYPYCDESSDEYDLGLSYSIPEGVHALQVTGDVPHDSETYICAGGAMCPDILYGVEKFSEPYSVLQDRGPISFKLAHALSAVSFRFRNASEDDIIAVGISDPLDPTNSSKVSDMLVEGFRNASKYVRLSEEGAQWGTLTNIDDYTFTVNRFYDTGSPISSGESYPSSESFWYTALMIPQDFGKDSPSFSFDVFFKELGPQHYTINFKDYQVHNTPEYAFSFRPGYHYVYNLNVTARAISCHVEVVPWIEDEPIKLN